MFGYALSCLNAVFNPVKPGGIANWLVEPPFWAPSRPVDLWTMSQQAGSNSYLWFSAGFSLLAYAAFVWWTDLKGKQSQLFRVFGLNPLAGYVLHGLIASAVRPFAPKDSPLLWVVFTFRDVFRNSMAVSLGARPPAKLHQALGRQGYFNREVV